jgi:2-oxoglutarate ferredoxin oxidoreductase subunit gamma
LPRQTAIRITGLGGQGIILAGKILAKAAIHDGFQAVQTQSYGAEARGTVAKSEVIISNQKIVSPMARKSDVLVVLSQTALDENLKDLKEDGILIVDQDLIQVPPSLQARIFKVSATKTAETELKAKMSANMVMLGAMTKITNIVTQRSVERTLQGSFSAEAAEKNITAFRTGLRLIEN